jgi:hypothetical protein
VRCGQSAKVCGLQRSFAAAEDDSSGELGRVQVRLGPRPIRFLRLWVSGQKESQDDDCSDSQREGSCPGEQEPSIFLRGVIIPATGAGRRELRMRKLPLGPRPHHGRDRRFEFRTTLQVIRRHSPPQPTPRRDWVSELDFFALWGTPRFLRGPHWIGGSRFSFGAASIRITNVEYLSICFATRK